MTAVAVPVATAQEESPGARAWRRLKRRKGAMAALVVVVLLILVAVLAPWVAPYDPIQIKLSAKLKPPSLEHWLGTDHFGRVEFVDGIKEGVLQIGGGVRAKSVRDAGHAEREAAGPEESRLVVLDRSGGWGAHAGTSTHPCCLLLASSASRIFN